MEISIQNKNRREQVDAYLVQNSKNLLLEWHTKNNCTVHVM